MTDAPKITSRRDDIDRLWVQEERALHTYEKRHIRAVIADLEAMTDDEWLRLAREQED